MTKKQVDKCDVCGSTKDVQCEVIIRGTRVDRVYHFCPTHWVQVYRKTLDDFLEESESKVNSYIKAVADKLIVDEQHNDKMDLYTKEDGTLDMERLDPVEIRKLRPYDDSDDVEENVMDTLKEIAEEKG